MRIKLVAYKDVDSSFLKSIYSFIGKVLTNPITLIILLIVLGAGGFYIFNLYRKKKRIKRQKLRLSLTQKDEQPRDTDYSKKFSFSEDSEKPKSEKKEEKKKDYFDYE